MSKEVQETKNHLEEMEVGDKEEWRKEEAHLSSCEEVIQGNIDMLSTRVKDMQEQTKEMYDNYRSDNPELHNELVVGMDLQSQAEKELRKNLLAQDKPYFGRIDYMEHGEEKEFSLYIGKNGVMKSPSEIMIVDWRAPIASVYYDSDIGESSYPSPLGETIYVDLGLKRTFEISKGVLRDFYDANVIANDEFLTKYLGKNKEAVLGEIIATIQKEQNDIIRDTPWHNIVVQGVAGSGKTTVAMHRISYILYNFKEKFRSDEFYIIGSNKMLLNYITGVLPNLDVYNINQLTMQEFFQGLLEKEMSKKKGYKMTDAFLKARMTSTSEIESGAKHFKGSLQLLDALELYLKEYIFSHIPMKEIVYKGKTLYTPEEIRQFIETFKQYSFQEKIDMMNKRLQTKIRNANELLGEEKEIVRQECKLYRNYFGKKNEKIDLYAVYEDFLDDLYSNPNKYMAAGVNLPSNIEVLQYLRDTFAGKEIDLYDLGLIAYIKKNLRDTVDFKYVKHIVVDEAQDFGVIAYGILKRLFPECTFTIMGDISQNIHYDTGMNDWRDLREQVFSPEKDLFYTLAKSYRNTVEISNYASEVLAKCSFETYAIDPVIRHGQEVVVEKHKNFDENVEAAVSLIKQIREKEYDTVAIICRTVEETKAVYDALKDKIEVEPWKEDMEELVFTNGVMVLPIHMTKGLEFDTVILWNPDTVSYNNTDADAKLLYVAITRALHELYVLHYGELSELLRF
ncbi:HelD family protein [Anaerosporobacter sp.]|uniref:HelD family protein n=1 Tax=Anaerosporobacter sp. TaxID=1872529 RepID=UPI00286FA9EC|nr:3'-5' exonuclease [Anaerosporobacter sp.]